MHRCCVCEESVCSRCSPSSVVLDLRTNSAAQRCCTPCISSISRQPIWISKLLVLEQKMVLLSTGKCSGRKRACTMDEALGRCESSAASFHAMGNDASVLQLQSE